MKKQNFFYFVSDKRYLISDIDFCAKSDRTFDLPFFDIANNAKLLNELRLYYIEGNYGVKYTYNSRGRWFSGYISSFCHTEGMRKKCIKNPTVRLLVMDEELLKKIKDLI